MTALPLHLCFDLNALLIVNLIVCKNLIQPLREKHGAGQRPVKQSGKKHGGQLLSGLP